MVEYGLNTTGIIRVARFILDELGVPVTAMKLQKLCYFAQGWTLAWSNGTPLFEEEFQAWRNGPVCYELFDAHRGKFSLEAFEIGDGTPLESLQGDLVRWAISPYRNLTGSQLSAMTHWEGPWVDARAGVGENAPSQVIITKKSMQEYFQNLGSPARQ